MYYEAKTSLLRKLTVCALAVVAVTVIAMNCRAGELDGTRAQVKVARADASTDQDKKGFDDTLSFADGKFTSTAFGAKGFQPARYNGEREEHEAEFEVEQTNGVGEVVNWLGNIQGNHVGGRVHWVKKDGTRTSYHFNGTADSNGGSSTNAAAVPAARK
jgi:hypothetical protein